MNLTCPCCSVEFPIEAGFNDADGKRLAVLFAEMEPDLGRAAIGYLRLFKPPKTALRIARAIKIVQQLVELVSRGSVCRDERGDVRRPATPAVWSQAIEQMLQGKQKLVLPIENHNYLRAIAFAIADSIDAKAEQNREQERRSVRTRAPEPVIETPVEAHLRWLKQQRDYNVIDDDEYERKVTMTKSTGTPA
jgi:hypothetical protein